MIKNDRQYKITRAQLEKFEQALAKLEAGSAAAGLHPRLRRAQEDALHSQIEELRAQLTEYDALRSGEITLDEIDFDELPAMLIRARIAAGLTQRELADRMGLKEQQIQRYEATDYRSASLSRLYEVIDALGVRLRVDIG
jgi:ribosome-binding protein aMBF1 (putative translation factor)